MKTWIAGLALWLLIGGLAAATVLWRLAHPPRLPALAAAGSMPQLPLPTPPPPFQLPPQEHYSDIVAYPVFIATRLPEPPSEDASSVEKPPSGPEPTPVLLGVMIMPQVTVALLRPVQPGAKTMRVRVGEMVGEWRLDAVFPHRVVLSKGPAKQELALTRPKPPAGSRPGRRTGSKPPPVATQTNTPPSGPSPVAPPSGPSPGAPPPNPP